MYRRNLHTYFVAESTYVYLCEHIYRRKNTALRRRTPIYTGRARCVPYSHRTFADEFRKMVRVETTRRCNKGVKKARVGDKGSGEKKKGEGTRKKEEEKKKQRVHLSSLDFPGVPCVSSLEQRRGNLIPFSIYLNPFTQTPLPTSSTFGLFLPFSACLPSAAVTSRPYSFFSMARLPSIRIRRAKGGTRFRHFLPPFTNVALRIFGFE